MAVNHSVSDARALGKGIVRPGEEEVGTELKLGEFEGIECLSLSEARTIINAVVENRKDKGRQFIETETLQKMTDYLDQFSRFKARESLEEVERLLSQQYLMFAPFERAQLGSLCCDSAEEAKTLIPSIQDKISDDDLQVCLDEITKLRQFTE